MSACLYYFLKEPASNSPLESKLHSSEAWKQSPFEKNRSELNEQPTVKVFISLPDQIDRLIATRNPANALKAYWLVTDCIHFQQWGNLPVFAFPVFREMTVTEKSDEVKLCSGLTERLKTASLENLSYAVKNGVSGAAIAFLQAGPFGDKSALESRPNDPLIIEWKKQAIAQLTEIANNGDYMSVLVLANEYDSSNGVVENNPSLAFTYAIATRQFDDRFGIPSQFNDERLARLQSGLSQDEINTATSSATTISANWLKNVREQGEILSNSVAAPAISPLNLLVESR